MERKLGLIGLSRSAHGQAFGGPGATPLGKKILARLAHCGATFCNYGFYRVSCHVLYRERKYCSRKLYSGIVLFPDNSEILATP